MFRQLAEAAVGPTTRDGLFRGRSPDCVRRDQVGTKTLLQKGCGLKNREGAGCDCLEFPNTPSSRTEHTDHVDRPRPSAMPNVQFRIAKMMSSQVTRCSNPLVPIIAFQAVDELENLANWTSSLGRGWRLGLGGNAAAACHMHDGQRNANARVFARPLLDCVKEHNRIAQNNGIPHHFEL